MTSLESENEILQLMPPKLQRVIRTALANEPLLLEIRLRKNQPVVFCYADGVRFFKNDMLVKNYAFDVCGVTAEELEFIFAKLCHYSVYSFKESLNAGFISLEGGSRVGVCAEAVVKEGIVCSVKNISSLSFRFARQVKTCAGEVVEKMYANALPSTIIIGAPCSGKTTLLREMCRLLSSGSHGRYLKCVLLDERGEIAAMHAGVPRFDVGINTDVLSFFPKREGILNALRVLSPDFMIADEIGSLEECACVLQGLNSGVRFIVSLHAENLEQAKKRAQFKMLIESGHFGAAVTLGTGSALGVIKEFVCL